MLACTHVQNKKMLTLLFLHLLLLLLHPHQVAEIFVFQSGFEPGSTTNTNYPQIVSNPTAQGGDIKGNTVDLTNSDWIYNLETKRRKI